jgi:UDP-glucose 4-epimerase
MNQLVVLGSSGFIGAEVMRHFKDSRDVLGVDRVPGVYTQVVQPIEKLSSEWWSKSVAPDAAIFFCAGKADVRGSLLDPVSDYEGYVIPVIQTLGLLQPQQRLILTSSAAVYSGLPCPKGGYAENLTLKSSSVYGWHRIIAEFLVSEHHRLGKFAGYDILRPFSLFGAALKRQVIYDLSCNVLKAEEGASFGIFGTGQETRDFVHVSAVPYVLGALLGNDPSNQAWNLSTGRGTTLKSLVERITKCFGKNLKLQFGGEFTYPIDLIGHPNRYDLSPYTLKIHLAATLKKYQTEILV